MKKIIAIVIILTITLLAAVNSAYIRWTEVYIIVGSASVISFVYNLVLKDKHKTIHILSSSAFFGFILSIVFSLTNLMIEHYRIIKGVPDGRFLTLGETFLEFSDDLGIIVLIVTCSVTLISFVGTTIYTKFFKKIA
jgi:hypothetical protein